MVYSKFNTRLFEFIKAGSSMAIALWAHPSSGDDERVVL